MVRLYLSNLEDRSLGTRVIEKEPESLKAAIDLVKKFSGSGQKLKDKKKTLPPKAAAIINPDEQMEGIQQQIHEISKQMKSLTAAVQTPKPQETVPVQGQLVTTPQKETRTCYYCGKPGHIAKDCWAKHGRHTRAHPQKKSPDENQQARKFPDAPKGWSASFDISRACKRCRHGGHWSADCKAPAPKTECRHCSGKHWTFDCTKTPENQTSSALSPMPPLNQQLN